MNNIEEIQHLVGQDYTNLSSKEFSQLVCSFLKNGEIRKEVAVVDRGDGRGGRVDIVYLVNNTKIAIELDRFSPRKKSIHKLKCLNADESYIITRAPFKIHKLN